MYGLNIQYYFNEKFEIGVLQRDRREAGWGYNEMGNKFSRRTVRRIILKVIQL